ITRNAETLEYGIVMDFAKYGDMRKYLAKNLHSTSWPDKLEIAQDIAFGLDSIHSSGMVHRDLHSGNILQYVKDEVTIGDLGLCQPTNTNNEATTTEEKKIYGVIPYIPPEVLRGEKFTTAGDIYSFSMLLWELATGKPEITSPLIPPCIAEIIVKCWDVNPENRPTAKELRNELEELWEMDGKNSGRMSSKIGRMSSKRGKMKQFKESEKYVKKMLKNDSKTNHSKTATTTTTKIKTHPQAVYTSRVLSLQMFEETKELIYSPKDDSS
ncbi:hypothetical protein G9A89_003527, partial [Geosiphon pyriformis]